MTSTDHYYLLLACDGRLVLRGWWGTEAVARRKFLSWIGEYGTLPGARITLTDERTAAMLASWPGQQELFDCWILLGAPDSPFHGLLDLVSVRPHRFRVCRDGRLHGLGCIAPAPQLDIELVTGEAGESRALLLGGSFQLDQLIGDLCHSTRA
ncbi:hypothetical protein [Streptomyces sp. NPDC002250]|uniref:hypothetical protein n=1 Tax=Streptomyces sp. NPDC002250 TaxID=3364641 RepID=UPI0036CFA48C